MDTFQIIKTYFSFKDLRSRMLYIGSLTCEELYCLLSVLFYYIEVDKTMRNDFYHIVDILITRKHVPQLVFANMIFLNLVTKSRLEEHKGDVHTTVGIAMKLSNLGRKVQRPDFYVQYFHGFYQALALLHELDVNKYKHFVDSESYRV